MPQNDGSLAYVLMQNGFMAAAATAIDKAVFDAGIGGTGTGGSGSSVGTVVSASDLVSGNTGPAARAQNTAVLQAAFNTNGIVWLPVGDFCHNPFVATGAPFVIGQGRGDSYGPQDIGSTVIDQTLFGATANTILRTVHTAGTGIVFQRPGVTLDSIKFANDVAHTAENDQTLVLAGPGTTRATRADGLTVRNCVFKGGYRQLFVGSCLGYTIEGNGFVDPDGGWSLWIENAMTGDEGDPAIFGNTFTTYSKNALGAVKFRAGGGVKFTGNKINRQPGNQSTRQYLAGMDFDLNTATSVLTITGNSIENISGPAIRINTTAADTAFGNTVIVGNEFFRAGAGGASGVIDINGGPNLAFTGWIIGGNVFDTCNGIVVNNVQTGAIEANNWRHRAGGDGLVVLQGVTKQVNVRPQSFGEAPPGEMVIFQDFGWAASREVERGKRTHEYAKSLTLPVKNVWYDLFRVQLDTFSLARVNVKATGSASNVGAAALEFTRMLTLDGGAVLPLIQGTDSAVNTSGGTQNANAPTAAAASSTAQDLAFRWNVTGISATLQVQVPNASTAAPTGGFIFRGTVELTVNGDIKYLSVFN